MRDQSTTTIAQLAQNTFLASAGDGELGEILGREAVSGEMTDLEQRRANSFRMATFAAFENVYLHHREGFIRDDVAASRDVRVARLLSNAPARQWREGSKQLFAAGFQQHCRCHAGVG